MGSYPKCFVLLLLTFVTISSMIPLVLLLFWLLSAILINSTTNLSLQLQSHCYSYHHCHPALLCTIDMHCHHFTSYHVCQSFLSHQLPYNCHLCCCSCLTMTVTSFLLVAIMMSLPSNITTTLSPLQPVAIMSSLIVILHCCTCHCCQPHHYYC